MVKISRYAFVACVSLGILTPGYAQKGVPELIESLREDDETTAQVAQNMLFQLGPDAVRPLEQALGDRNFKVRRRAAEVLGRFGPQAKRAAPELVQLLADPQFEVHHAAENALIQMGDDAVPAVADALKSDNEGLRKIALSTLSRCGPKGIPVLIQLLKKDESAFLRASAAGYLGAAKPVTSQIVEALIAALSDLEEVVRASAANALGQPGALAAAAIGPLLVVAQSDKDALTRTQAAGALQRIGPATKDSMAGFIAGLRHPSVEVRRQIIEAIGRSTIPFADASPALVSALKDLDAGVRLRVVQVSVTLGGTGPAALPVLRQTIGDASPDVRAAAIEGLGRLKDAGPEAATELGRLHADPNPVLRQNAIHALGNLGLNGLPGLIQALGDPYSALSDDAAKMIVRLGPDALPLLQAAQTNPDPAVQKKVSQLIKSLSQKPARRHP